MKPHVLVVDDDPVVRDLLRQFLHAHDMDVSVLHDGKDLRKRLMLERPAVVVLDIMMPGIDGLTALKDLRASGDDIPVILLTARDDVVDRVIGLELGADDYIGKPFDARELLTRINTVLKRRTRFAASAPEDRVPYRFGQFELDFVARMLSRDGERLPLRPAEFAMLKVLVNNPAKVLSRAYLHEQLRGLGTQYRERSLDVPIWRLRRLLEIDPSEPRYIQTVWGEGYRFMPHDRAI